MLIIQRKTQAFHDHILIADHQTLVIPRYGIAKSIIIAAAGKRVGFYVAPAFANRLIVRLLHIDHALVCIEPSLALRALPVVRSLQRPRLRIAART